MPGSARSTSTLLFLGITLPYPFYRRGLEKLKDHAKVTQLVSSGCVTLSLGVFSPCFCTAFPWKQQTWTLVSALPRVLPNKQSKLPEVTLTRFNCVNDSHPGR
jgi:hypothetical protein